MLTAVDKLPPSRTGRRSPGPWPQPARLLLTVMFSLLASACDQAGPDAALADYNQRLARTLKVDARTPAPPSVPTLPERRSLRLDLPSGNLGTLDFLALSGCAVQITIGKRNSSLGLMASASQRLLLELEYLQLAPDCITHMRARGSDELADTLEQAWQLKQRQLPALIFNATLGGPEFRQFWRRPASLGDYPAATSSAVITALDSIGAKASRWLTGDYTADNLDFELDLNEVSRGDGGALMLALSLQHAGLAVANRAIAQRGKQGPLCRRGIRPAAADILPTVVRKFFIDAVQPWSAQLGQRQHQLLPAVRRLERLVLGAQPLPYRQWRQRRDQVLALWVAAPRQHVNAIQELLEDCGQ